MKTASLIRSEQDSVFNHLISLVLGASTYKQLKSVWWELSKMQKEIDSELGASCWVMSYYQGLELTATYNNRKQGEFIAEVEKEIKTLDLTVANIEKDIYSAKTLNDLKQINRRIYSEIKKKDAKEYLTSISRKAYQEILGSVA